MNDRFYSGDDGFGLDLDAPLRVEQLFDGDHGGCGADVGEDLAVGTPDLLPVLGMGEVDARTDDVLERGAGVVECGLDELEDGAGLVGGRKVVRADGAGSGDVDDVADANGARETDDGLVGDVPGMFVRVMELMLTKSALVRYGGDRWRDRFGRRKMARRDSVRATVGLMVLAAAMAAPMAVQAQAPVQNPTPVAAESQQDLGATQQRLMQLLRVSPTLAEVVASDPSLLADQQYVARSNPELATFLQEHPEIGRNPAFWLFSELRSPQQKYYEVLEQKRGFVPPRDARSNGLDRVMSNVAPMIVMIVLLCALAWIIRTLVENRRWTKVFTLQSEVHGKLIDRFASNQELLGYMETDAGRRFLEAAPIVTEVETRRMPNLVSRMMATLQVGLVLMLLGAGLITLRGSVGDASTTLLVLGVIALMPGIGLILSAGILWLLGKRLNLIETPYVPSDMDLRGRE